MKLHRGTVEAYEQRGTQWALRRKPVRRTDAREFAKLVVPGAIRVDLGCGAGRYTTDLGSPVIGIDASRKMLEQCRLASPGSLLIEGDLEHLPFRSTGLHGAWANMSYVHVARAHIPLALADLHRSLTVGARFDLQVLGGDYEGDALEGDDVGGRFFCGWTPARLGDVLVGAGFEIQDLVVDGDVVRAKAVRMRSLPDYVGPSMRLLVVGLNPSLYSADAGVGFARPSNRFWRAAVDAGLLSRERDCISALSADGVGMTDLVKRATRSAGELEPREYAEGMKRLERLVTWLAPRAVCMVGLSGWRAAKDREARAGVQQVMLGGRPVYVMPSTSGANAHVKPSELEDHLKAAVALAS